MSIIALAVGSTALACPTLSGSYWPPGDECLIFTQASDCSTVTFNWLGEDSPATFYTDGSLQAECDVFHPGDCTPYSADYEGSSLVIYTAGSSTDATQKTVYARNGTSLEYSTWTRKSPSAPWTSTDQETWAPHQCGW